MIPIYSLRNYSLESQSIKLHVSILTNIQVYIIYIYIYIYIFHKIRLNNNILVYGIELERNRVVLHNSWQY